MLDKYANEFKRMHEEIRKRRNPLEVIKEHLHLFESEGIGAIGIAHYLGEYISKRK